MPNFNHRSISLWTNYGEWNNKKRLIEDDKIDKNVYSIIISKTVEQKVSTPLNPCYKNVNEFPGNKTIINHIRSINLTYKQMYCHELCGELLYIQTNPYNCTNLSLGNVYKDCLKVKDRFKDNFQKKEHLEI